MVCAIQVNIKNVLTVRTERFYYLFEEMPMKMYKELFDAGILTQDEFETKKKTNIISEMSLLSPFEDYNGFLFI